MQVAGALPRQDPRRRHRSPHPHLRLLQSQRLGHRLCSASRRRCQAAPPAPRRRPRPTLERPRTCRAGLYCRMQGSGLAQPQQQHRFPPVTQLRLPRQHRQAGSCSGACQTQRQRRRGAHRMLQTCTTAAVMAVGVHNLGSSSARPRLWTLHRQRCFRQPPTCRPRCSSSRRQHRCSRLSCHHSL